MQYWATELLFDEMFLLHVIICCYLYYRLSYLAYAYINFSCLTLRGSYQRHDVYYTCKILV